MSPHARSVAPAIVAGLLAWLAETAGAHPPAATLATVEIHDRTDRTTLAVFEKDGRRYVIGQPGHEYAIRIRNAGPRRILAVTSVDGINVISGETASPDQTGYVIEPRGSVEIAGWRKSLDETAAFFFADHAASYAARTGRPLDVGVIGVAVFDEDPDTIAGSLQPRAGASARPAGNEPRSSDEATGAASPSTPSRAEAAAEASRDAAALGRTFAGTPESRLGTGHGRREPSFARQVTFERASSTPAMTIVVQYDRRENLVALGVLPPPRMARREPQPFPRLRFAPDPPAW